MAKKSSKPRDGNPMAAAIVRQATDPPEAIAFPARHRPALGPTGEAS
ncbi:MAG: hypothetical protein ACT4OV_11420 [Microthrixaceae bacterium]